MSEEAPENGAAPSPRKTRTFRAYNPALALTPEQARRQSDVLRAACRILAGHDAPIAFLNDYNQKLGGKPLQVALDSDEGLVRVERLLETMHGKARPRSSTAAARGGPQQGNA